MPGTSTSADMPRATDVQFYRGKHGDCMGVLLDDGRLLGIPLALYPTLSAAKPARRQKWRRIGRGHGNHWPSLDLDLSTSGLVAARAEVTRKALRATKLTEKELLILNALHRGGVTSLGDLALLLAARFPEKDRRAILKKIEKRVTQVPRARTKSA